MCSPTFLPSNNQRADGWMDARYYPPLPLPRDPIFCLPLEVIECAAPNTVDVRLGMLHFKLFPDDQNASRFRSKALGCDQ